MMTDNTQENIVDSVSPGISVGTTLRDARERRQLSIEDIHNRLRISLRQIVALENDEFSALPESTITRGFIRNYAKFLDIDAEPLLAAYKSTLQEPEHKNISIPSANIPISQREPTDWKKYVYASLIIIFCVVGWLIYNDAAMHSFIVSQTSPSADKPAQPDAPVVTQEITPLPALPQEERLSEPAPMPTQPETPVAASGQEESAAPPVGIMPVAMDVQAPANEAGKLELSFSADSWVGVSDRSGKEIFNKTKRAGTQDEVMGEPPFKVIIGNAGGVQLNYNGKPVDLAPYTRLNVARITLE